VRVAVVGSGPAGFYAAEALFGVDARVLVDLYDRLPAPFGLVRYGVAPDHAKIKNVIKVYERTAQNPNFAFLGNVAVGDDISVDELRMFYDAIIFACGAETDRRLGIPGEDLPGSYTATEFVAWYNGHPDYQGRTFDLSHEVAVVIGQGNVAIDVARILSKTVDELKTTDITARALELLAESRVREIYMIGRRGPVQAAFTPQEIKEFGNLADCDPVVDAADLEVCGSSQVELKDTKNSQARKNYAALEDFAGRPEGAKSRRFIVRFFQSPIEIRGEGKVEEIVLEKNALIGEPFAQKAAGTGEKFTLPCGAFFRSVGYRGVAIPGVPFEDRKGIFPNRSGRILADGQPVRGMYAAGWIKRGPSGIIGTNKPDSIETAKNVIADLPSLEPCERPDRAAVFDFLVSKGVRVVNYDDWRRIDAAEIERGKRVGKPREKFVDVQEMIAACGG
jgi:ferredoxin--NADP+ reductase